MTAPLILQFADLWVSPEYRNETALQEGGRTLSYGELHAAVARCAGGLRATGVEHGELVAMDMGRSVSTVVAMLGLQAAGACPAMLEPGLNPDEVRRRMRAAGAQRLLTDESFQALPDGGPWWSDRIAPGDPGLLLFTSGSTGRPKGVLIGHGGLLNNALGITAVTGLAPSDVLLHVMPLHHTNGVNNQIFSPLLAGSRVVLGPRFRAGDMPALMQEHRPTIITGVPTMYSRMLDQAFDPSGLSRLRFARCGSAPITDALHERIESFLGCPLIVSYGLSEATCTSTMNPPERRRIGSIGRALPHQTVFLAAADGSRIPAPGREGEICIQGPSLMLGYVGVEADGRLQPQGEVLRTGDLGRMDEDGYFTITGRIKDVILRGGENLSPAVMEACISAYPGVRACCVIGVPHADLGEVPRACVVADGGVELCAAAIKEHVARHLPRMYRLEEVVFLDRLPENAVGKVDRKALARRGHEDKQG